METIKHTTSQILASFLLKTFRFLASLKLAITVMLALMICMSVGTFVESYHGTETARLLVYDAPWFSLILLLLGLNVTGAALDRYPWKKKHTGFVITHLGIILILIGSFLTQGRMIDGQMTMPEGNAEKSITLSKPMLLIQDETAEKDWFFELRAKPFAWTGTKSLLSADQAQESKLQVLWKTYYPKANLEEKMVSSESGPAAAQIHLQNSFVDQKMWLRENDPKLGSVPMGPAVFSFASDPLQAGQGKVSSLGYIELEINHETHRVALPEDGKFPFKSKVEGTDLEIEVTDYFQKAIVEQNQLVESTETSAEKNPAVRLWVYTKDKKEFHTAFAKFPEFPTVHGMQPSSLGLKVYYRLPETGSKGERHELRLIQEGSELKVFIQDGFEVRSQVVKINESISLGWMDLKMTVLDWYPHSEYQKVFTPLSNTASGETVFPALELQLISGQEEKSIWLAQGIQETLVWQNNRYHFLFGEKRIPAGFRLFLKDFRVENYPGTNNPASFESDVILYDDSRGFSKETTISMNKPLHYRGFHIYQSGYSLPEGGPEVSVFSVGRDPGIPLKYIGTIVMVIGIVLMFYFKSYSRHAGTLS